MATRRHSDHPTGQTLEPPAALAAESGSASPTVEPSFEVLLEGIREGFFALDSGWRFTVFNHAAEQMFGLSRANVIGKTLREVSPGIVGTEFERRYRIVMSERTRQEFESYSALLPECFHEVRAFPFGEGIGVAFRDVTDRQRVLQALGDREGELARVQRVGGVGGVDVDLANGFRARRSPEYRHLHGLPPSAVEETHEDWLRRVHPDDRAWLDKHFRDTVASNADSYKAEYRIIRPSDGALRWIRAVTEIERDADGRPLRLIGAHLDVTERKHAEQAALRSEERLRAIADALPLLISYIDTEGVYRFANKPYEVWFGRPLDEIVGKTVRDLMEAQAFAFRRPFLEQAFAGETVKYEADLAVPGAVRRTEIVHVPHRDATGRVVGLYNVIQDITARTQTERVLSESEQRFRSIANSAPVPIWVSKLGGQREFVNRAYHEFLGVSLEEALVFDWRNALHSDDRERILREQRTGESSHQPFTLEARYLRGDGQWRWLRSESQPRWGPNGDHIGFIGVGYDVTTSKEAEQKLTNLNEILGSQIQDRTQQLAATEALIQTFFQHSSECHAVLVEENNAQFRYEEVNPATLRLYDKTREQVVGHTIEEVFGAAAAWEIGRHLETCIRFNVPYRYERAHGEARIEAIATPAPSEPGSPKRLVVSARDVTERRQLEQQLRQSQKMEAVGQLTGGVAHDFNNLLTIVLGGLEIIGRQTPKLPAPAALAKIERAKDMAMQGVERAVALTSRLLAFSRLQTLSPQAVDANTLVAGLSELLRRTLGEAIELEAVLADELWLTFADPNQLENALLNLALNARDAMPDGGRLMIVTANAGLERAYIASLDEPIDPGDYVMIAVADTGAGMDAATLERAFDPFFTTKEVGKGTGLGLSQVYGFARQSAGHVKIYSEIGVGTTVKIYLPRSEMAADVVKAVGPIGGAARGGGETILLVEDNDVLRAHARDILEELGYCVREASAGAAALEILGQIRDIHLLLTDVVMPGGLNGRQLADQALKLRPQLKVLFMTGYNREAIVRHGRLDAGVAMIGKPFSFEELGAKVREALSGAG